LNRVKRRDDKFREALVRFRNNCEAEANSTYSGSGITPKNHDSAIMVQAIDRCVKLYDNYFA